MIARLRHWRLFGPLISRRIIGFVKIDRERVAGAAAEDVNFAVDRGYASRTERRAHGSKFLPLICRWVVCQGDVLSVRMNEIVKPPKT